MNWLASSHQIIALLVAAIWLLGFAFLLLGRRWRDLDWLSLSALGIFVVVMAIDLFFVNRDMPATQKIWARGWIGPRDQNGAITIGIIEDPLGLTITLLSALLGAVLLLSRRSAVEKREERADRTHAGVLMSVAGVSIAWLSLTPWFSILGMMISALGGIVVLGARRDPDLIAQFGREKTWGFILSFSGAAVLGGERGALTMERGLALTSQPLSHPYDLIGAALLVLGVFTSLQPLPFSNWLSKPVRVSSAAAVIGAQIFPALASFALLIRFEPQLRTLGVFDIFQWIGLATAFLAAICGLAQKDWKTALPLWFSSAISFVFAALGFAGPSAALPILLGVVLSAAALAVLVSACESSALSARAMKSYRALCLAAAAPGIGMIGFVSCGGFTKTLVQAAQDPVKAALFALALIFIAILLWKSVFSALSFAKKAEPKLASPGSLVPIISVIVLVLVGLGLIWTGTFTGGAIPHDPDRAFASWLGVLLNVQASDWGDDSGVALGEGLFWSATVIASLLSIWLFGGEQDRIRQPLISSPSLLGFIETGYSVDRAGLWLLKGLRKAGSTLEKWLNQKVSVELIPRSVEVVLSAPASWIDRLDKKVYQQEESILRQWIDVPAKALQLVQNGDLQWYLIFAIGCVVAMLIHFLRT